MSVNRRFVSGSDGPAEEASAGQRDKRGRIVLVGSGTATATATATVGVGVGPVVSTSKVDASPRTPLSSSSSSHGSPALLGAPRARPPPPPRQRQTEAHEEEQEDTSYTLSSSYTSAATLEGHGKSSLYTYSRTPSHLSAGQSSYDSSSSPISSPSAPVLAAANPCHSSSRATRHTEELGANPVDTATTTSSTTTSTSTTTGMDVDILESGHGSHADNGKESERHVLRQYEVLPIRSRSAKARAEASVAVKVPEAGEALNLQVISEALKAYEERRQEQLFPSRSGRLAPPQAPYTEKKEHPSARVDRPPSSSSCGCASSCTCRQCRGASHPDSCSPASVPSSASSCCCCSCSTGDASSSASASCCSTCSSAAATDACSCASCQQFREDTKRATRWHHHKQHQQQQRPGRGQGESRRDPFQAANLLAAPPLLYLPALSALTQKHAVGQEKLASSAAAGDGGGGGGFANTAGGLSWPIPPLPCGQELRSRSLHQHDETAAAQQELQEQQEHRQFLEDALAALDARMRQSSDQLQAIQTASEKREAELTQRLAAAEAQLVAKEQAIHDQHHSERTRLESWRCAWEAERRAAQTDRSTSPPQSFATVAREEYARQREKRSSICSKGTMTCHDPTTTAHAARHDVGTTTGEEGGGEEEAATRQQLLASPLQTSGTALLLTQEEEERSRCLLEEHCHSELRLLSQLFHSFPFEAAAAQTERALQEQQREWNAQARLNRWGQRIATEVVQAELASRASIERAEEQAYWWELVIAAQRASAAIAVAEVTHLSVTQQKEIARLAASVEELEHAQDEGNERERALRLQLLNALRMPTTTIVARPSYLDALASSRADAVTKQGDTEGPGEREASEDGPQRQTEKSSMGERVSCSRQELLAHAQRQRLLTEAELPVHRRFARAHQEAVKAVRAQHREV